MHDLATAAVALSAAAKTATTRGGGIFGPIARPIAAILAAFYSVIPNYGVAILLLSVAWMVLISPLTLKTTRSMLAMQKLQPEIKKLQDQHKNDRQAFAAAQMELFKEHKVSPFGSCLPSLLPLPVFIALFDVINGLSAKVHGHPSPMYLASNTKMYHDIVAAGGRLNAFGMDLSRGALSAHSSFVAALPYYAVLLGMMATQYFQTAQMMSRNPASQQNSQTQIMKFLPLIFGLICIRFPAGVIIYYGMSNLCRMIQQSAMYRFDPKVKALVAKEVIEVEAKTKSIDRGSSRATPLAPDAQGPRSRFRELLAGAGSPPQAASARTKDTKPAPKPASSSASKATGRATTRAGSPQPSANGSSAPSASRSATDRTAANGSSSKGSPSGGQSASNKDRSRSSQPAPKPTSGRTGARTQTSATKKRRG